MSSTAKPAIIPISTEIVEGEDGQLAVLAEVKGYTLADLKVSVEPFRLIISGKKAERIEKEIFRAIELPAEVDAEKSSAKLNDDILTVTLTRVD